MIPQRLILKNFLSYRDLTLDFHGLHTACICGPNGSGKSSLLEAITWGVWGQSRASVEDHLIHIGTKESKVDFIFRAQNQLFRVIRTRHRGQGTSLEFQGAPLPSSPAIAPQFRTLTGRSVRATQQRITQCIKLDYDTFVNSAYLRQGRADEFMLKRPSERKQILADLLKLDQYDGLSEQARDKARQLKGQITLLEQTQTELAAQLDRKGAIAQDYHALVGQIEDLRQHIDTAQSQYQQLQTQHYQRQTWIQQLKWQKEHHQVALQEHERLCQEWEVLQHQHQQIVTLLAQEHTITTGYYQWQQIQTLEEQESRKFRSHQVLWENYQHLHQTHQQTLNQQRQQLQIVESRLKDIEEQRQEIQEILHKQSEVDTAFQKLELARRQLKTLDQQHGKVAPLLQRKQELQRERDRQQARLQARLEELQVTAQHLRAQQQEHPQLEEAAVEVATQVKTLEAQQSYLEQVRQKASERRQFIERLQEQQRQYQTQLATLDHTLQLLKTPGANCPLCARPLEVQIWQNVLDQHQNEHQELLNHIWVIREQLLVSEREIQVLQEEFENLNRIQHDYGAAKSREGQLQAQLHRTIDRVETLQKLEQNVTELEQLLHTENYVPELQTELQELEKTLASLNYDERNHALARGEVDRWRWAESRYYELKQAHKRVVQIDQHQRQLQGQWQHLKQEIESVEEAPEQQQIVTLEAEIRALNYNLDYHEQLRRSLRKSQDWSLRYRELQQARQHYPTLQAHQQELSQKLNHKIHHLQTLKGQISTLEHQICQTPDCIESMETLEHTLRHHQQQLEENNIRFGQLQQQLHDLEDFQHHWEEEQERLNALRYQQRVYEELAQAFGKNGIQALMIENVLPQLEAEANRILSRLSANQLQIQFATQRASRQTSRQSKWIDTLDILIADTQGTRPYETYSGGEGFRINFSIRLALARLLAQRSGAPLQMLIIDEGFGTQDQEGCDRLVAAINAIASDFACILAITHIPHLKEAFQTHVEVWKTNEGSQVRITG